MIQALLAGRKSQTRRIIKPQPRPCTEFYGLPGDWEWPVKGRFHVTTISNKKNGPTDFIKDECKYQIGDILWVKEAHYAFGMWRKNGLTKSGKQKWRFYIDRTTGPAIRFMDNPPFKVEKNSHRSLGCYKRSSLFMFAQDARIFLKVTDIKVERACDISEEDAIKEGIESIEQKGKLRVWKNYLSPKTPFYGNNSILSFRSLFESINGPDSWEKWVWVYSFNQIDKPC
jgi:hypothetical protein